MKEERISEFEDILIEIMRSKKKWEKGMKKNQQEIRDIWDVTSYTSIPVIVVPEWDDRDKSTAKNIWNNNDWDFLKKDYLHFSETQ